MKNNNLKLWILLVIFFSMFNLIVLFVPFNKCANFWISYAFSNLAILLQFVILFICLNRKIKIEEKFFNIPMVKIGFIYLALQLFASTLFMIFNEIPYWFNLVIDIIILGLTTTGMVLANLTKDILEKFEDNVTTKVSYIPKICIDIKELEREEEDELIKGALKRLGEKIRFSDPVSTEIVYDIENEIMANINKLKSCDNKLPLIESINNLIEKRNELCKMTK